MEVLQLAALEVMAVLHQVDQPVVMAVRPLAALVVPEVMAVHQPADLLVVMAVLLLVVAKAVMDNNLKVEAKVDMEVLPVDQLVVKEAKEALVDQPVDMAVPQLVVPEVMAVLLLVDQPADTVNNNHKVVAKVVTEVLHPVALPADTEDQPEVLLKVAPAKEAMVVKLHHRVVTQMTHL